MRSVVMVLLVALSVSMAPIVAEAQIGQIGEPIEGWSSLRKDMELFKGAIDRTVANTVLNAYLPGYGVVFMFSIKSGLTVEDVQREVERALRFITPTIETLPAGERIAVVGYREDLLGRDWELMYISEAASSDDPTTWMVYFNRLDGLL